MEQKLRAMLPLIRSLVSVAGIAAFSFAAAVFTLLFAPVDVRLAVSAASLPLLVAALSVGVARLFDVRPLAGAIAGALAALAWDFETVILLLQRFPYRSEHQVGLMGALLVAGPLAGWAGMRVGGAWARRAPAVRAPSRPVRSAAAAIAVGLLSVGAVFAVARVRQGYELSPASAIVLEMAALALAAAATSAAASLAGASSAAGAWGGALAGIAVDAILTVILSYGLYGGSADTFIRNAWSLYAAMCALPAAGALAGWAGGRFSAAWRGALTAPPGA